MFLTVEQEEVCYKNSFMPFHEFNLISVVQHHGCLILRDKSRQRSSSTESTSSLAFFLLIPLRISICPLIRSRNFLRRGLPPSLSFTKETSYWASRARIGKQHSKRCT